MREGLHTPLFIATLVILGACAALVGCGGAAAKPHERSTPAHGPAGSASPGSHAVDASAPFRFFAPTAFWNVPVGAGAPAEASSAAVVSALAEEVAAEERAKSGPWINTTRYSVPVYTVAAGQPTVRVKLEHHAPDAALSSAWSAVPLPPNAQPAGGSDGALALWQPSTDRLWEFWRLAHVGGGWQASWGGAMQDVSSGQGVYGPQAWPGAKRWWGVAASSLPLVGGLISLEDLERGQIDHALSMAIPDVRAGVYASPAQRDDGASTDPLSLPEGAHLRLNPDLDLAALHLPPLTSMIAEAAQRYGIFVTDRSANVTFYAQDPITAGADPYTGPDGYFQDLPPTRLLASFPWSQLELLETTLHRR